MLDGMFSFVLLDTSVTPSRIVAARDPIGITTLYMGFNSSAPETLYFASELKAIHEECDNMIAFPPGHFYDSNTKEVTRYFKPTWWDSDKGEVPHNDVDYKVLRESLEAAVKKRLMSEVPYGVLLSGGLDSSLIASIAARETDKMANQQEELRKQRRAAIAEGRPVGECLVLSWRDYISLLAWSFVIVTAPVVIPSTADRADSQTRTLLSLHGPSFTLSLLV
jgi:asparagine synthase (glutamine-hydrolysing)